MTGAALRVEVMHGVNLDRLGERDAAHYGTLTLAELEHRIAGFARELEIEARCFQTNHEGEFVQRIHALPGEADALILNPGAWTHYSWAIHDAVELSRLPAVEVHISDVDSREPWRRVSVLEDVRIGRIAGRGADGYRDALQIVRAEVGR